MKRAIVALAAVVVVGMLSGCGVAQRAAARKDLAANEQQMNVEYSDHGLDPIRGKVPFRGNRNIVPTSLNEECPNDAEKEAINLLRQKINKTKQDYYVLINKYNFYDSKELVDFLSIEDFNLGRLYKCQLNFQTYAETMERAKDVAQSSAMAKGQEMERVRQIQAQQAAAAFGAALQNAGAALQQQEAIRQANRPRQTICRRVGDTVNCTEF